MSDFPKKTCSIDRLLTHPKLVAAALSGTKTQQRRAGVYAYPGETFELEGVSFVVSDLRQEDLGTMTEEDRQRVRDARDEFEIAAMQDSLEHGDEVDLGDDDEDEAPPNVTPAGLLPPPPIRGDRV